MPGCCEPPLHSLPACSATTVGALAEPGEAFRFTRPATIWPIRDSTTVRVVTYAFMGRMPINISCARGHHNDEQIPQSGASRFGGGCERPKPNCSHKRTSRQASGRKLERL